MQIRLQTRVYCYEIGIDEARYGEGNLFGKHFDPWRSPEASEKECPELK